MAESLPTGVALGCSGSSRRVASDAMMMSANQAVSPNGSGAGTSTVNGKGNATANVNGNNNGDLPLPKKDDAISNAAATDAPLPVDKTAKDDDHDDHDDHDHDGEEEPPPPRQNKQRRRRFGIRAVGGAVDRGLIALFGAIARAVAQRPVAVLAVMGALGLLMGAGLARINVVTDYEALYTPQKNMAFKDRDYVEQRFGYEPLDVKVYAVGKGDSNSSVLTQPALLTLLDVYRLMANLTVSFNGSSFSLVSPRICYRPGGPRSPCSVESPLDYWGYSEAAIRSDTDLLATINNPRAVNRLGQPLSPESVFGLVTRGPPLAAAPATAGNSSSNSSSGTVSGAAGAGSGMGAVVDVKAMRLTVWLQNNREGRGSSSVDPYTQAWQKALVPLIKAYKSEAVDVYVLSPWDENDTSDTAIYSDVSMLMAGYLLLFLYGLVILSKPHPVESRAYMGLVNVVSVGLAAFSAYGLCSLVGLGFSLVSQVLALLLLGLGTDDMLVTMAAHEETAREYPLATSSVVDRVVATVSRARRGVIVAALTNFVAFCTGIISELPALRDFMIYAAVGVILVLVFQSTFFVAALTLDVRRQCAHRCDTFCCVVSNAGPTDSCCPGHKYDGNRPGVAQTVIGQWLPMIILHPAGKLAVLALTLTIFVFGVIGSVRVQQNFDIEWFIPNGFYLKDVYTLRSAYFTSALGKGALPVGVYTTNPASPPLDYFYYQDEMQAVTASLKSNPYVSSAPPVVTWYDAYLTWLANSTHAANLTAQGRPPSSPLFHAWLHQFLLAPQGRRFTTDVLFTRDTLTHATTPTGVAQLEQPYKMVEASRTLCFTTNLNDSPQEVSAMHSMRASLAAAAPALGAFPYSFPFLFFEGFAVIQRDTILAVALCAAVVFLLMLLLLGDLVVSVLVGLMVAMIDIELMGFLYWAGLSFNAVTSINLILAIGIAVDYSAFTAYSFLSQVGTRQERARKALAHLGVAVFNGGFTMFLAVLPLALAKSFIFQTFFKMFSMIVLLGLWHGLCTLPVLLSFMGTPPYESALERHEQVRRRIEDSKHGEVSGDQNKMEWHESKAQDAPMVQTMV
ncbi:hypothetical protein CLOP_g21517 [Closterium sp. NIES-67]|nr:hypothetical protein CLOP_g21517 [Closterium sp. NIES-67]